VEAGARPLAQGLQESASTILLRAVKSCLPHLSTTAPWSIVTMRFVISRAKAISCVTTIMDHDCADLGQFLPHFENFANICGMARLARISSRHTENVAGNGRWRFTDALVNG
jgi:hypothetical protein